MSNRILWILIILWFIWTGYLYYNFSYIPTKKAKEIRIELEKQKKDEAKVIKRIELVKQKQINVTKTKQEKIKELREDIKHYKTFKLENNKKAYFTENNWKLDLYYDNKKIWVFDLVYSKYLLVELILGDNNDLFIEIWNKKYYYNNKLNQISKIDLNVDVLYVKEWNTNNIIFVTKKWSFIYNIYNNTLNYFSFFNDFVYFKEGYIWIIKSNDSVRIKNLWLWNINKTLIYYYNPDLKEKKVLYSSELSIDKIYIKNNRLYIETIDNNLYILENI